MNIQYYHKRSLDYFAYAFDIFGGVKTHLRARGGTTIALEVPTMEQFNAFKITPLDHWGPYDSVELEVGLARCSTEDNYNKKVGRLKSKGRMKPVGFWVRKNSEGELILSDFQGKFPELILKKSPNGTKVYFVGVNK